MEYTKTFSDLKAKFSLYNGDIVLDNGNGIFRPIPFTSNSNSIPFNQNITTKSIYNHNLTSEDILISENKQFSYPV